MRLPPGRHFPTPACASLRLRDLEPDVLVGEVLGGRGAVRRKDERTRAQGIDQDPMDTLPVRDCLPIFDGKRRLIPAVLISAW